MRVITIALLVGACTDDGMMTLWQEDFEGCGLERCGWTSDASLTIVETFHPGEHALRFEQAGVATLTTHAVGARRPSPLASTECELQVSLVTPCYSGYDNRAGRSRIPEVTLRDDVLTVTLAPLEGGTYINAWFENFETTLAARAITAVEIVSLSSGCAIDHLQLKAPTTCAP